MNCSRALICLCLLELALRHMGSRCSKLNLASLTTRDIDVLGADHLAAAMAKPERRQSRVRRRGPCALLQPGACAVCPRRPTGLRRAAAALSSAPRPLRLSARILASAGEDAALATGRDGE